MVPTVSPNARGPVGEHLDDLAELIVSRPGRSLHLLPDLALKMFAVQVLQYGHSLQRVLDADLNSWAFPLARTTFETAEDMAYLAFARDIEEYDRLGALAMVGAEVAISKMNGLLRAAGAVTGLPPMRDTLPEGERVAIMADEWSAFRPEAAGIVHEAHRTATAAWAKGIKHWSTLSRQAIHSALDVRLNDPTLSAVLKSWYDILAVRSHAGLHSPHLRWDGGQITFLTDGDADHPVPLASLEFAVHFALCSLQYQFGVWEEEGSSKADGESS